MAGTHPAPAPGPLLRAAPLLVAVIWGVNLVVMKVAFAAGLHPFAFNALRLALSVLVLAAILRCLPRQPAPALAMPWGRVFGVGLCGSVLNQCLSVAGIASTTAGNAAFLGATSPVWTALLAAVLGVEAVRARTWIAIAITSAGSVLIVVASHGIDLAGRFVAGNLMVLGAAFLWALTTTLSSPLMGLVPPARLALWSTAMVLPIHAVLLAAFAPPSLALDGPAWGRIAYAGVLSTGVAYVLWNQTIRAVGPSLATVYANLVPLFAVAASALVLDEPVTPVQIIGGGLIVGGVLLARVGRGPGVR